MANELSNLHPVPGERKTRMRVGRGLMGRGGGAMSGARVRGVHRGRGPSPTQFAARGCTNGNLGRQIRMGGGD